MNKGTQKLFNIILAFLISVGAWMYVVYNYYPMTDVKYMDIPISFSGERALADRGLAVSSVARESVRATLRQKRIDVNLYSSEDISAMADVSDCVAGDNNVSISVSGPPDTSVISSGPGAVEVEVERTGSAYMDIDVIYSEGAPDNNEPIASDLSQTQAEVVCAASKLGDVKRIAAVLNYDEMSDTAKSFTAKLAALDKDGNVVPHTIIYPDEISLDASAGVVKEVSVNAPVNSNIDDNYDRKYTLPGSVTIIGPEDVVELLSSVNALETDIRYVYEDSEIPLEFDLPEGVYLTKKSEGSVLRVTVTQKPDEKKSDEKSKD